MGTHTAIIDVLLYVPMTEAAREIHTVTIGITAEGEDINYEDNQDSVDMITGSIHIQNSMVHDGHACNDRFDTANQRICYKCWKRSRIQYGCWFHLSTSPQHLKLWLSSQQALVDQRQYRRNIDIPNECRFNKNALYRHHHWRGCSSQHTIVITLFVEGGHDEEGRFDSIEHQNLIMVDQQRKINMTMSGVGKQQSKIRPFLGSI